MRIVISKLIAVAQAALLASCTGEQPVATHETDDHDAICRHVDAVHAQPSFPSYPPDPNADPTITHEETFIAPLRFLARREGRQIGVSSLVDYEDTFKLPVGKKMTTGYRSRMYLRDTRTDDSRRLDEHPFTEGIGSWHNRIAEGVAYLNPGQGTVPEDLTGLSIEVIVDFFETDVPGQHAWIPFSKKYKVLWSKSYRVSLPPTD